MPDTSQKRWVIVFLIYADFRLSEEDEAARVFPMNEEMKATLDLMFSDIMNTPVNPDRARLFVIMNGINYKKSDANAKVWTENKTLFYSIINSGTGYTNRFEKVELLDSGVLSGEQPNPNPLQRKDVLKKILGKCIKVSADEEVLLITWNHGSAFGIFRERNPRAAERRSSIDYDLGRYPYLKQFWTAAVIKHPELKEFADRERKSPVSIIQVGHRLYKLRMEPGAPSFLPGAGPKLIPIRFQPKQTSGKLLLVHDKDQDRFFISHKSELHGLAALEMIGVLSGEKVTEILSNDELAEVINSWLDGRKLAVMVMMNCWMMNLHAMYSFHETVCCFVAPQSDIGSPGYNYREILKAVYKSSPNLSAQQLATVCVETSENKKARKRAGQLRKDYPNIIDSWKIFAADLQRKDEDEEKLLCKQLRALEKLISEMNRLYYDTQKAPMQKFNEAPWLYKYVRSVSFDFSKNDCMMVDILNWSISILYAHEDFETSNVYIFDQRVRDALSDFRETCLRGKKEPSIMLNCTEGPAVYTIKDDLFKPTAVIGLVPKGYSLFFPLFKMDPNWDRKYEGVLDNLKKDKLLGCVLSKWKLFLRNHIDENIDY